jgi:hypothetical protein
VPRPLRAPIELHGKRLLHPLHDRRKLQPFGGPDVERQPPFHKSKPPKLEGKAPARLAKHLAEDRYRLLPPEQRLVVIDHRPNLVPGVLNQKSLLSHTIYGFLRQFDSVGREKGAKKAEKG